VNHQPVVVEALNILATRQVDAASGVRNPPALKASILKRLTDELTDRATDIVSEQPTIEATALADLLDDTHPVTFQDGTVAAQSQKAEANAKRAAETANEPVMSKSEQQAAAAALKGVLNGDVLIGQKI
jgi:hypothetical protein